jgi:hypothetical protein
MHCGSARVWGDRCFLWLVRMFLRINSSCLSLNSLFLDEFALFVDFLLNFEFIMYILLIYWFPTYRSGPGSSVGITTGYGLDCPGIESRWGEIFRTHSDRP